MCMYLSSGLMKRGHKEIYDEENKWGHNSMLVNSSFSLFLVSLCLQELGCYFPLEIEWVPLT